MSKLNLLKTSGSHNHTTLSNNPSNAGSPFVERVEFKEFADPEWDKLEKYDNDEENHTPVSIHTRQLLQGKTAIILEGCFETVNNFNISEPTKAFLNKTTGKLFQSLNASETEMFLAVTNPDANIESRETMAGLLIEQLGSDAEIKPCLVNQLQEISTLNPEELEEFAKYCLEENNSSLVPTRNSSNLLSPTSSENKDDPTTNRYIVGGVFVGIILSLCLLGITANVALDKIKQYKARKEDNKDPAIQALINEPTQANIINYFKNAQFTSEDQFVNIMNRIFKDDSVPEDARSIIITSAQQHPQYKMDIQFQLTDRATPKYQKKTPKLSNVPSLEDSDPLPPYEPNPPAYEIVITEGQAKEQRALETFNSLDNYDAIKNFFMQEETDCATIIHCFHKGIFMNSDDFQDISQRLLQENALPDEKKFAIKSGIEAQDLYPFAVKLQFVLRNHAELKEGYLPERKELEQKGNPIPSPEIKAVSFSRVISGNSQVIMQN